MGGVAPGNPRTEAPPCGCGWLTVGSLPPSGALCPKQLPRPGQRAAGKCPPQRLLRAGRRPGRRAWVWEPSDRPPVPSSPKPGGAGVQLIQASHVPRAGAGHGSARPGGVPGPRGGRRAHACGALTKTLLTPGPCPPPGREPGGGRPGRRSWGCRWAWGGVVLRGRGGEQETPGPQGPEQAAGNRKRAAQGSRTALARVADPGLQGSWAVSGARWNAPPSSRAAQGGKGREPGASVGVAGRQCHLETRQLPGLCLGGAPAPAQAPQRHATASNRPEGQRLDRRAFLGRRFWSQTLR